MAVVLLKNRYVIQYKMREDNGVYHTITVQGHSWAKSVGKRYVEKLQDQLILEDKKRRKLRLSKGDEILFEDVVNSFERYVDTIVKQSTAYGYCKQIEKHIKSFFNLEKKVNEALTLANVESYRNYILELGYSQKHTNDNMRLIRDLVQFCIDRDYLTYEYGNKLIRATKNIKNIAKHKEKLKFWTNEERSKFSDTFEDTDRYKMLFRVCYECALRLGELMALTWKDFDPSRNILIINKSCDNFGNITTPKNSASDSEVSISENLKKDLLKYQKDFGADSEDFMFFADRRASRTTIRRVMNEHIKTAKVPPISPHGLRHSCASRMINAGCDALIVSKHLRHSSTQMTLDTYSHLFPQRTKGLVDKIF